MLMFEDGSMFEFTINFIEENVAAISFPVHMASSITALNSTFMQSQACVWHRTKSLHVVQGEFARCALTDVRVIGSTDATTCLIAVAVDAASPHLTASVCHFDEATVHIENRITNLVAGMTAPYLYLVGATPHRPSHRCHPSASVATTAKLLETLHYEITTPIIVKLFCVLKWNGDASNNGAPLFQSLALSLSLFPGMGGHIGNVRALHVPPGPQGWPDRGPLLHARLAQGCFAEEHRLLKLERKMSMSSHECVGLSEDSIYDEIEECMCFRLFLGSALPRHVLDQIQSVAELRDDHEFLQRVSTTPEHELSHVVDDIRGSYRWILDTERDRQVCENEVGGDARGNRSLQGMYKKMEEKKFVFSKTGWVEMGC